MIMTRRKIKEKKKSDKEGKNMTFNKKGHAYYVEWDYDASSEWW